jgi:chromosome segregation protein
MKPRLKALELHGYKTFASKVQFEFLGNITAIVGPNGSGKSNISDSLRWVLGEQSYTLLRGKKTEDMIFSGSDQRPRAGMASATVVFDNEENWLPIDYSEVSIARRAYRDGNNEYLLNKQRVRLKDISELLAQSGLAERTYTIIGQGLVDAALSLRPEERRRFFEEAAGIGLFRARREESISRLDSTRRNLERVQDILSELEPRLKSLERQAKRADEYDHVKADLHILLKDWYGFHWQNTQKELLRCREILKNQEERVRLARDKRIGIESSVQEMRAKLGAIREQLAAWHLESAGFHTRMEKTSKELAVLDERKRALDGLTQTIQSDISREEEQVVGKEIQLSSLLEEKQRLTKELVESQEQLDLAQQQLALRLEEREKVESALRQQRRLLTEIETRQVQLKAHQRELSARAESQNATVSTLTSGIEQSKGIHDSLELQKNGLASDLEEISNSLEVMDEQANKVKDLLKSREADEKSLYQQLSEVERSLTKTIAKLEVIEQAELALAGLAEGAKSLLEAVKTGKVKGKLQTIGGLIDVPANLEIAIGSVLGDQLDGIVISSDSDPENILDFLEGGSGRAVLYPQGWIKPSEKVKNEEDSEILGNATDLVKFSDSNRTLIDLLLGQVIVVKSRAAARRLMNSIPPTGKIVTLTGEVFHGTGVITAGKDKRATLVGRPRQKRELEGAIDNLSNQREEISDRIESLHKKMKELSAKSEQLQAEIKNKRSQKDRLEHEFQTANRAYEQQVQKTEWQKSQLSMINAEISKTGEEFAAIEASLLEGTNRTGGFITEIQNLTSQLRLLPLDELQSQVTHWTTTVAVNSRSVSEAERRYADFSQSIVSNRATLGELKERLVRINQQLLEVAQSNQLLTEGEATLASSIQSLQVKIDPAENELKNLETEYSSSQELYTQAQQAEANQERSSTQAQLELARTRESLESLRRKIEEDFGLVTLEYSEEITGPTPLPLEGISELKVLTEIPSGLEESINRQRALLRRMGAINPDAQKEFHEVKERFDFLTSQMEDLKKADVDLRQIITELDDLMRKQFRTTFNAVAIEFKQLFTRLFGGGSARLILTDDENPTETGIDIEAKLPGRREQGLSLLSGGERALTAVALIFSLLKVSPTPFCVMDEVDAMLDEANVGRFTELLKELSQETQFIVITHNRNTVQVADVIYGVTMGRDSASQVISLRLDEVSEEMVKR